MAEKDSSKEEVKEEVRKPADCDNHPGVPSVLESDLDGAVQEIHLCEYCLNQNSNLQRFV